LPTHHRVPSPVACASSYAHAAMKPSAAAFRLCRRPHKWICWVSFYLAPLDLSHGGLVASEVKSARCLNCQPRGQFVGDFFPMLCMVSQFDTCVHNFWYRNMGCVHNFWYRNMGKVLQCWMCCRGMLQKCYVGGRVMLGKLGKNVGCFAEKYCKTIMSRIF
jgi:hypothetical protein